MSSPSDVLVLGGGPAGLAAARACIDSGLTVEVIEQGKELAARIKDDPIDAATGIGGAGLYSDGKFSFYPSASRLWQLEPFETLLKSYNWTSVLLRSGGLKAEPFPESSRADFSHPSGQFERKHYPSYYMPLPQRLALIESLAREIPVRPLTRVRDAVYDERARSVILNLSTPAGEYESSCRGIIFAGGRFGSFLLPHAFFGNSQVFRRVEVGVRIEQDSNSFFLKYENGIDPKFIAADPEVPCEWRTFCCCRDGIVITSIHDGFLCLSGRADCPPTGKSNVGFNIRITDEDLGRRLWPEALRRISSLREPVIKPFKELIEESANRVDGDLHRVFGPIAPLLLKGLRLLGTRFADLRSGARIHAPTVEGIGYYPEVDDSLRMQPYPAWVAGDASGIFRGLTAALVSGYHAGMQASSYLR